MEGQSVRGSMQLLLFPSRICLTKPIPSVIIAPRFRKPRQSTAVWCSKSVFIRNLEWQQNARTNLISAAVCVFTASASACPLPMVARCSSAGVSKGATA